MKSVRPRIIANFAMTADGKVSTRNYTSTGFTSSNDKRRLQEIRFLGDAIMAGRNTVVKDNMSMGLSADDLRAKRAKNGLTSSPLRVLISNSGKIDIKWKIFNKGNTPIVLFTTQRISPLIRKKLPPHVRLEVSNKLSVDLCQALQILRKKYAVRTLVCEGGPGLFRTLVEEDAIDELYLTCAPLVFGGKGAPTLTGIPDAFLQKMKSFRLRASRPMGDELFLHYSAKRS